MPVKINNIGGTACGNAEALLALKRSTWLKIRLD